MYSNPLVLAGALAGLCAGRGRGGRARLTTRSLRLALPFAVLVVAINGLVSQRGATVVFRGGTILGHRFDVTAESLGWGAVTAMQICCIFLGVRAVRGRRRPRRAAQADAPRLVPLGADRARLPRGSSR